MTSDDSEFWAKLDAWIADLPHQRARRAWRPWALTLAGLAGTLGALWVVAAWVTAR